MTATAGLEPGVTVRVIRGGIDQHHPTDRVVLDELQDTGVMVRVYDRAGRHVSTEPFSTTGTPTEVVLVREQPALPAGATLDELLAHQARNPATSAPTFGAVAVRRYTEATGAVRDLADVWDHHAHGLEVQLEQARQIAAALEQENAELRRLVTEIARGDLSDARVACLDYLAAEQGHGGERAERP